MRVLIVRLSSMGDVVQTLPALTDAARSLSDLRFDFAVDESFADIPALHYSVDKVFASPLRRWRRNRRQTIMSGELKAFIRDIRHQQYDLIVDMQGEWKSAGIARLARGPRAGYEASSAHEWGAPFAYQQKYSVPKRQHSIARMRQLLAQVLHYAYQDADVDYGIVRSRLPPAPSFASTPYLVFIHSTSWESKNWPENYWRELTERAIAAGFKILLPWGTQEEQQRSLGIASGRSEVVVLPQLSISEKASVIANAVATVGLDTGLSHIAAALDVPSVTIYGATDPGLVGATGRNQVHLLSNFECVNCHEVKCSYDKPTKFRPACFVEITADRVWQQLQMAIKA